jgi:hypothetical protein
MIPMKINNLYSVRVEVLAYAILILGVVGDHISTTIGLSRDYVRESNPIALGLMDNGIWIQTDIILIVVGILSVFTLLRIVKNSSSRIFLFFPVICGLVRLGVTFWNLSILF